MARIAKTLIRNAGLAAFTVLVLCRAGALAAPLEPLEQMETERWAKLAEAERYQLKVAEKFYLAKQWKVAADEYEKFLKLYEKSEGAPYSQLMWSHCQIKMRKQNTAIKDGYQSVIDYYPDSPEAPVAAILIGQTYRSMGDTKLAKKAYLKTTSTYPKHFAAVMARLDLVEFAAKENDPQTQEALLRELTFNVERKGPTVKPCQQAAQQLAHLLFRAGNFDDGLKAFATTTALEEKLPANLMDPAKGALPQIVGELTGSTDEPTKKLGEKLADVAAGWLKARAMAGLKDEKRKEKAIEAWYAAAEVRRNARQPDKQKAVYDEMLKTLGADDALLGRLAQWYKDNKQMEQARSTYAKYKDAAKGQGQIAASYEEENQHDKAAELYKTLALSDTKSTPTWLKAAATAYRNGKKPDQAMAIYRELLTADVNNVKEYHFQIAETLYGAQRWKEAIAAYKGTDIAYGLRSSLHMAHANRQLKQYDEAINLYRQIILSYKDNASGALYQIAKTHEDAGRKEEAIKYFKQVCDQYPKSQEGSQAHSRLNNTYKITVTLGGAKD